MVFLVVNKWEKRVFVQNDNSTLERGLDMLLLKLSRLLRMAPLYGVVRQDRHKDKVLFDQSLSYVVQVSTEAYFFLTLRNHDVLPLLDHTHLICI